MFPDPCIKNQLLIRLFTFSHSFVVNPFFCPFLSSGPSVLCHSLGFWKSNHIHTQILAYIFHPQVESSYLYLWHWSCLLSFLSHFPSHSQSVHLSVCKAYVIDDLWELSRGFWAYTCRWPPCFPFDLSLTLLHFFLSSSNIPPDYLQHLWLLPGYKPLAPEI